MYYIGSNCYHDGQYGCFRILEMGSKDQMRVFHQKWCCFVHSLFSTCKLPISLAEIFQQPLLSLLYPQYDLSRYPRHSHGLSRASSLFRRHHGTEFELRWLICHIGVIGVSVFNQKTRKFMKSQLAWKTWIRKFWGFGVDLYALFSVIRYLDPSDA